MNTGRLQGLNSWNKAGMRAGCVKPWELLGETRTTEGSVMALTRRDREYIILADGKPLMSSRMHGSEEALAALACERARTIEEPRVLVGGLGMGFTLRAALDALPPGAVVIVAELVAAVVQWNRDQLGSLAGHPLKDRRVHLFQGDVLDALRSSEARFDAVILDIDNGPAAFTASSNSVMYSNEGIATARVALKDEGVLAVWSAWDDRKFEQRLAYAGFDVAVIRVRARLKRGGPRHTLFLGRLPQRLVPGRLAPVSSR
jgi:spermidine synthase